MIDCYIQIFRYMVRFPYDLMLLLKLRSWKEEFKLLLNVMSQENAANLSARIPLKMVRGALPVSQEAGDVI